MILRDSLSKAALLSITPAKPIGQAVRNHDPRDQPFNPQGEESRVH